MLFYQVVVIVIPPAKADDQPGVLQTLMETARELTAALVEVGVRAVHDSSTNKKYVCQLISGLLYVSFNLPNYHKSWFWFQVHTTIPLSVTALLLFTIHISTLICL